MSDNPLDRHGIPEQPDMCIGEDQKLHGNGLINVGCNRYARVHDIQTSWLDKSSIGEERHSREKDAQHESAPASIAEQVPDHHPRDGKVQIADIKKKKLHAPTSRLWSTF